MGSTGVTSMGYQNLRSHRLVIVIRVLKIHCSAFVLRGGAHSGQAQRLFTNMLLWTVLSAGALPIWVRGEQGDSLPERI